MNKKLFLSIAAALLCAWTAFSQDYGLTLRSLLVLSNGDKPYGNFDYTGSAVPWFSAPLGTQGDLYLSGGISAVYSDSEWKAVPEVYRFEASYRFGSGMSLEAGRLSYRDPLNMVMNGLFDGIAFNAGLGNTRLSAGAFYTGLLYKKTAYITMSPGDYDDYSDQDVYFASRRLVFSLAWEIPDLFDTEGILNLGLTGQFDLNDPEDLLPADEIDGGVKIHSQYASAKFTLPFLNYFNAELKALLGITEETGLDPGLCFAFSGGAAWLPPGALNDRLSLNAALSSGARGSTARAFLSINTIGQGKVLRPKLSGLALVEGAYNARLHQSLSAEVSAAYFFRTDTHTYGDSELDKTSLSPLLGGEVYGSLNWAPVSDISFILGGGAFFPQLGKSFATDASLRWRVSLETTLSF
ncbi:MAG: hypothetical protein LBC62_08520 [Treponema sp.]|jgi:hypothetical protein|nr:hypothetical protein [Treponema sp.]